eukprot:6638106-Alexandrium_andersonii.AAC.1
MPRAGSPDPVAVTRRQSPQKKRACLRACARGCVHMCHVHTCGRACTSARVRACVIACKRACACARERPGSEATLAAVRRAPRDAASLGAG